MGFGTGNHETTYLCLKEFLKLWKTEKFNSCLDFGCGSGILGLAIRSLSKDVQIDLYDIDEDAILNCRQNLELNGFNEDKLNIWGPKEKKDITTKYDLVFANILQDALLAEKEIICDSVEAGGMLIISGLLNGQEDSIINAYTEYSSSLKYSHKESKGDWICLVMRRQNK